MSAARIALERVWPARRRRRRRPPGRAVRRAIVARKRPAPQSRAARRHTRLSPRRIALIGLLTLLALGGGWFWLRDSSLVRADDVRVSGLSGPDAPRIRALLTETASDMTTLHVRADQLRDALAPYPIVKDIRVSAAVPHTLRIEVIEHDPVAAVVIGGRRVAVASDGTVLDGTRAAEDLIALPASAASAGGRLTDRRALQQVALLGAAPAPLRALIGSVGRDPSGLRVMLVQGPVVVFGSAARLRAKWAAAARVIADPDSAGATYVDVRVPQNAVAGRFAPEPVPDGVTDEDTVVPPDAAAGDAATGQATAGEETAGSTPEGG